MIICCCCFFLFVFFFFLYLLTMFFSCVFVLGLYSYCFILKFIFQIDQRWAAAMTRNDLRQIHAITTGEKFISIESCVLYCYRCEMTLFFCNLKSGISVACRKRRQLICWWASQSVRLCMSCVAVAVDNNCSLSRRHFSCSLVVARGYFHKQQQRVLCSHDVRLLALCV